MAENIYIKLAQMRVELQKKNIKKSGENTYTGYSYYELEDILPAINVLQAEHKTCSFVSFFPDRAELTLVNAENPEETMVFNSPMAELSLKGANAMQNVGGVETYQRRYLYMTAFEVTENDYFDAVQGQEKGKNPTPSSSTKLKQTQKPTQNKQKIPPNDMTRDTYDNMMSLLKQTSQRDNMSGKDTWTLAFGIAGKDNLAKFTEADGQKVCSTLLEHMERAS